jgi:hypothetical protein
MNLINGLTLEEAVKKGVLIPLDLSDPTWAEKLKPHFNDNRPPIKSNQSK